MAVSNKFFTNDDLGLGTSEGPGRGVNKDGSVNVRRRGLARVRPYEFYHHLITMGNVPFLVLLVLGFLATNILFAAIYVGIGMESFTRPGGPGFLDRVLDAFFFSAQTLTTVGYGQISPKGHLASTVAAMESLLGLLSFALATGLFYGRFSRPQAQIRFSQQAVVAPYRDITGFMFRFINRRTNQLIEVEAAVSMAFHDPVTNNRRFVSLTLERSKINLFPTNWTVVHPIDESSPLRGMTAEDLKKARAEFIILIKAFDDTFSQTIYQRTSYTAEEVAFGARFQPMSCFGAEGRMEVDMDLLDAMEKAG
jgi:inward rectifier potassium channel